MRERMKLLAILAVVGLLLAAEAQRSSAIWGLDVAIGAGRTSLVVTAATIRLAFVFGQDCAKTDSGCAAGMSAHS